MATWSPTSLRTFVKRHSVLSFYALVFALSWGCLFFVIGPESFLGTKPISPSLFLIIIVLAPLLGPGIAGVLMTSLVAGRTGLRDLLSRLLRWRIGLRWYAVALLTAPLLTAAILFALSLTTPAFLPAIVTSADRLSLLVVGIVAGLVVAFFEELGWTGFATPELRKRHSVLGTGLIIGLLWGVWHFPLFAGTASSSGPVPPALYMAVLLFSWLLPYRVLMVWVYDRTKSLLVVILMHVTLVANQFVFLPSALSGGQVIILDLVFAAMLWVVVGVVVVANSGTRSRTEKTRAIPQTTEARTAVPS
jgi:membrane protease YdiL (CAAX protease family)